MSKCCSPHVLPPLIAQETETRWTSQPCKLAVVTSQVLSSTCWSNVQHRATWHAKLQGDVEEHCLLPVLSLPSQLLRGDLYALRIKEFSGIKHWGMNALSKAERVILSWVSLQRETMHWHGETFAVVQGWEYSHKWNISVIHTWSFVIPSLVASMKSDQLVHFYVVTALCSAPSDENLRSGIYIRIV